MCRKPAQGPQGHLASSCARVAGLQATPPSRVCKAHYDKAVCDFRHLEKAPG